MGRFGTLKEQRLRTAPAGDEPARSGRAPLLTKRGNPAFQQFSAYLPRDLYLSLKAHLAGNDIELSDAVEQALRKWLEERRPAN